MLEALAPGQVVDPGLPSPQSTERSVVFMDIESASLRPAAVRVYVAAACRVLNINVECGAGTWTRRSVLGNDLRTSLWGPLEHVPPNPLVWPREWCVLETFHCRRDHRVLTAFEADNVNRMTCRLLGRFVLAVDDEAKGACLLALRTPHHGQSWLPHCTLQVCLLLCSCYWSNG